MAQSLVTAPCPRSDLPHPHPARSLRETQIHSGTGKKKKALADSRVPDPRQALERTIFKQWSAQGGRWEVERRCPSTVTTNCFCSLLIQENNGELGLNKPESTTTDDCMPFLRRIPGIHSLEVHPLIEVCGLLAAVPELFPKVCSLEINDYDYDCDVGTLERLSGSAGFAEWSLLTRQLFTADQVRVPRAALTKHSSALTSMITEDMAMDELLVVAATYPALRVLNVEYLRICGSEFEVPAWVCTELRELSFA